MMRWETHAHTAEGSACSSAAAADMVRGCKKAGYDGIFITDHFYHGNTAVPRELPWTQWVERFCLGYYHAKEEGDKIGLQVCFGWEYSWSGNDFLTYGLTPEWLLAHPETVTLSPYEYLKLVKDAGACIIHAHPFRQEWYVQAIRLVPDMVHGVEVYNGNNAQEVYNDRALWYADSFGLPRVAGSDTHWSNMFQGGILTDMPIDTAADYKQVIEAGGIRGIVRRGEDCLF